MSVAYFLNQWLIWRTVKSEIGGGTELRAGKVLKRFAVSPKNVSNNSKYRIKVFMMSARCLEADVYWVS